MVVLLQSQLAIILSAHAVFFKLSSFFDPMPIAGCDCNICYDWQVTPQSHAVSLCPQEICLIASDANQVLDQPDQQLLNLIPASRSVTIESVGKLRRFCMEFLAACISWDQFRCPLFPLPCPALLLTVLCCPGLPLPCPAVVSPGVAPPFSALPRPAVHSPMCA